MLDDSKVEARQVSLMTDVAADARVADGIYDSYGYRCYGYP